MLITNSIMIMLLPMMLWELAWKAFGLYHSAKNGQWAWFVVMLLFNTMGLIPMVYLFFARKDKNLINRIQ